MAKQCKIVVGQHVQTWSIDETGAGTVINTELRKAEDEQAAQQNKLFADAQMDCRNEGVPQQGAKAVDT